MKWYTEVLGLEYVRGQVQHNEYTGKLVAFPDAALESGTACVCPGRPFPGRGIISNWSNTFRRAGEDIPLDTNRNGVGHWAFMVDDIHAEFTRLKNLGVQFKADAPIPIEQGVNKGGYAIYFQDPDGITLELLQPPP